MASTREGAAREWLDPAWRAEAEEWTRRALAGRGVEVIAPIEQPHVRPWATALRVTTTKGVAWFKANIRELAYEVAIVETVATRRPDSAPRLFAADRVRGWMLLDDAGDQLSELYEEDPSLERWTGAVRAYADLQVAITRDARALTEAGVPDRTAPALVEAYARVLDEERNIRPRGREGLDDPDVARLRSLVPRLDDAAATLAELGLPDSVQHDDLHPWNVFLRGGHFVVIDWGDSCISQPLLSLGIPLEWAKRDFGRDADRVRDAYLEPWTAFRPHAELVAAVDPALLLAHVTGILKWALIFSGLTDEELGDYRYTIVARLRQLLERACG